MTTVALYISILSASMSNPSACHDRLALAIQNAPAVVTSFMPRAKVVALAESVVAENSSCRGGMMLVRNARPAVVAPLDTAEAVATK